MSKATADGIVAPFERSSMSISRIRPDFAADRRRTFPPIGRCTTRRFRQAG